MVLGRGAELMELGSKLSRGVLNGDRNLSHSALTRLGLGYSVQILRVETLLNRRRAGYGELVQQSLLVQLQTS